MINAKKKTYFRIAGTYLILILFCLIALYPVSQILTVSLRPADRLMSTSLEIIPKDASLRNYRALFTERPFFFG